MYAPWWPPPLCVTLGYTDETMAAFVLSKTISGISPQVPLSLIVRNYFQI